MEDLEFKENMKICMQCVIHKYAKTIEDIQRLEKVIKLTRKFETYEETLTRIGKEEGIEQGRKQGIEQGIEQGLEQGRKQGIEQEKRKNQKEKEEMAKKLLEMNIPMEKVKEVTNLNREKIIAIQSTIIL